MKRIVISMAIFLFVFTIYHSYMFYQLGTEPSTLIACVFSACSVEAVALMYKKIKGDERNGSNECDDINGDFDSVCTSSECDSGTCEECMASRSGTD